VNAAAEPVPVPVRVLSAGDRVRWGRWARRLAWATVAYNTVEGVVAVAAGAAAGSVALVSFGLDSAVEVASALVVAWQFTRPDPEAVERRALRVIGVSFLALAAWVTLDAVRTLAGPGEPAPSRVGIGLTCASLVVMPALVWAKRRAGRRLGSATVAADSTQTLLCAWLSAVVLAGLVANAAWGWGWADPVAALVVAAVAAREGVAAWRGDACCTPALDPPPAAAAPCSDGCCPPPATEPGR